MAKEKAPAKEPVKKDKVQGKNRTFDVNLLAEEIVDWASREDSINFSQFCADRGYLPSLIWQYNKDYEVFSRAYMIAKMKLAERRERMLNNNILNYGTFQRYQAAYDPFLRQFETEVKDEDAARAKGIAMTEKENFVLLAKLANQGQISQKD
jgi:hypothetical protein